MHSSQVPLGRSDKTRDSPVIWFLSCPCSPQGTYVISCAVLIGGRSQQRANFMAQCWKMRQVIRKWDRSKYVWVSQIVKMLLKLHKMALPAHSCNANQERKGHGKIWVRRKKDGNGCCSLPPPPRTVNIETPCIAYPQLLKQPTLLHMWAILSPLSARVSWFVLRENRI